MGADCKEWIGYSKQDYVDIAVELASEGKRNIAMREELRQKLKDSDLNNANRLCRELERIYKEERHGIMDI
jgi:predicted O-linked N-acetylglucosamine transferase (SPINDLY family)